MSFVLELQRVGASHMIMLQVDILYVIATEGASYMVMLQGDRCKGRVLTTSPTCNISLCCC